jgi:hypothetical protein
MISPGIVDTGAGDALDMAMIAAWATFVGWILLYH